MSEIYTPSGAAYAAGITVPQDGDPKPVASVTTGLKGLAENVQYLLKRVPNLTEVDGSAVSTIHGNEASPSYGSITADDTWYSLATLWGATLSIAAEAGDIIRVFCTTQVQVQPQPSATDGDGGFARISHRIGANPYAELDGTLGAFWNTGTTNNQARQRYTAETFITATSSDTHDFSVDAKGVTAVLGAGASLLFGPAFALRAIVYRSV